MARPVTIVVPCFNEAERLEGQTFLDFVQAQGDVGFLFVDDGSSDGTRAVLEALADQSDGLDVFGLDENSGKAEAVRQGTRYALESDPAFVGYFDADLATPLDALWDLKAILDADPEVLMVMGARVSILGRDIQRSRARHYLGRVFATMASMALRLPVYDTQCGAKLFRVTPVTRGLFAEPFSSRWIFDVELIARLQKQSDGMRVVREYPLREWRDVAGSKVSVTSMFRSTCQLFGIAWRYR